MEQSENTLFQDYSRAHYLADFSLLRGGGDPFLAFLNGQRVYDWLSVHLPDYISGDILDVGCGDGRVASAFARNKAYQGRYFGFDINLGRMEKLKAIFGDREGFDFGYSDVFHSYYNPNGKLNSHAFQYSNAKVDGVFNLIIYNSIFSHMSLNVIKHHFDEAFKYLSENGRIWATGYILDNEMINGFSNQYWDFSVPYDLGFSATPKKPEGCVAFHEKLWQKSASEAGLKIIRIIPGYWKTPVRSLDQHKQDVMILAAL